MDAHIKYYFKDISLGQTAEYEKQVTDEDVRKFADISGDYNPIHLDDEFAKDSMFGARIAHGILTASHISAVIGYIFPGPGWIYLGQSYNSVRRSKSATRSIPLSKSPTP